MHIVTKLSTKMLNDMMILMTMKGCSVSFVKSTFICVCKIYIGKGFEKYIQYKGSFTSCINYKGWYYKSSVKSKW